MKEFLGISYIIVGIVFIMMFISNPKDWDFHIPFWAAYLVCLALHIFGFYLLK